MLQSDQKKARLLSMSLFQAAKINAALDTRVKSFHSLGIDHSLFLLQ